MMHIFDCIGSIKSGTQELVNLSEKLERLYFECDFEKLLSAGERSLRSVSDLYLLNRELLLSLYELTPSLPRIVDISKVECEALHISIEALREFDFPVYKISLPFLLPNKRKRDAFFRNAVTNTVAAAVMDFCSENNIWPLKHATVFFVSSYEGENYTIDNDNKESSVILNSLNGRLLRDDRPGVCNTVYYTRQIAEGAKTEIYIVDSDHDIAVLSLIKKDSMSQTNALPLSQT